MLNWSGFEPLADFLEQHVSHFPLIAEYFDFDQLVAFQSLIQFMNNVFRQACRTYLNDRLDGMGKRLEVASTSECKG